MHVYILANFKIEKIGTKSLFLKLRVCHPPSVNTAFNFRLNLGTVGKYAIKQVGGGYL